VLKEKVQGKTHSFTHRSRAHPRRKTEGDTLRGKKKGRRGRAQRENTVSFESPDPVTPGDVGDDSVANLKVADDGLKGRGT